MSSEYSYLELVPFGQETSNEAAEKEISRRAGFRGNRGYNRQSFRPAPRRLPPQRFRSRPRPRPVVYRPALPLPYPYPPLQQEPRQSQEPSPSGGSGSSAPEPSAGQGTEYMRWVQTTLNQALNLQLPVDGLSNVQTRSAIRSFQEKNGLPVTGMVGPDTEKALMEAVKGQPSQNGASRSDEPASAPSEPGPPASEFEFEWEREVNRKSRDYIKWLQQSLNQVLGLRLVTDGNMGPQTRSAIRSFQQKQGLVADGIVGEKTESAIKKALDGLPRANTARMVDPAKVSCAGINRDAPIFKAIGTTDPVGLLEAVSQRAVQMLDNTISEMTNIRARVRAGEPPAWPVINDVVAWSLKTRMLMRVDDPKAWTGSGTPGDRRTAELIIRWLSNIRKIIAGGQISYTCLASANCNPTTWAWVFCDKYRINLCRRFWHAKAGIDLKTHFEFQAQTIIHEASHIYYCTEDQGLGPGAAECISQFVADANGSPIDNDFVGRCGPKEPKIR